MIDNGSDNKLQNNVTRTVGVNALRRIRSLIEDDKKQTILNRRRAIFLLVLLVVLFASLMFYIINRSPLERGYNAGLPGVGAPVEFPIMKRFYLI
ncbi:MAG TPA: hypothetical protein ENJ87_13460 [Gammaproteobacteria bacterium]|nr:hypothetical protein [Gammaproteobacteria bacterium]